MPAGPDRRDLLQKIFSSYFGRLNLKATRPDSQVRERALRNALKGSVSRLLDAPRFSAGVVNNRDLTWKGRTRNETLPVDVAMEEAPEHDAFKEAVADVASSQDWSSVGYDPRYRTIRRLTEQEELRFVALAKVGDGFAQQKLIVHHLPLLKTVARRYANKGLALSELVNEGTFGLVRAIERFDLGRELRFGTYAKWWIRDAIEQALLKQSRMIRTPGHVVRSMREQQRNEAQDEPWVLEYNTRLGDTEAETILMMWEDDFAEVALRTATGSIEGMALHWRDGCAVSIAVAPKGYPDDPVKTPISLPFPGNESVKCFGSIIRRDDKGQFTTGPGRVACVTAVANDATACRKRAYDAARSLDKHGRLHYRRDIALELELTGESGSAAREAA
ncbi:MAG: sigma-70 family RNA polymerase sigma factor [Noviherbaspirillum sp.]